MHVVYRLACKSSEDSIHFCSLYNSTYNKMIDSKYYFWQFFSTPFPSYLFFAELDGVVVGSLGVHVKTLLPQEKKVLSVIDMMISPLCRGKGIFSGLMRTAMLFGDKYSPICAVVMANEVGRNAICGSLGWYCVTELETMQMIIADNNAGSKLPKENSKLPSYEKLQEAYQNSLCHISHDNDYYRWRFQTHPLHEYTLVRDGFDAYSIIKVFENPETFEKFGDLVEIVGKDANSIRDVGYRSSEKFSSMGVQKITTWLQTNTLWDGIGMEMCFHGTGQMRYFCVSALGNSESELLDPGIWFLQPSDTEIY